MLTFGVLLCESLNLGQYFLRRRSPILENREGWWGFRTGRHCGRSSGSLHMPPRWHDEDRFALHGNLFYVTRYVFSRYFLLDIPTCTPLGMLM